MPDLTGNFVYFGQRHYGALLDYVIDFTQPILERNKTKLMCVDTLANAIVFREI
jgi:hypothetical protein